MKIFRKWRVAGRKKICNCTKKRYMKRADAQKKRGSGRAPSEEWRR